MSLGEAVQEFVKGIEFAADDPRVLTGRIAVQLARGFDERPSAASAREVRLLLADLAAAKAGGDGPPVDQTAARAALRRFEQALAALEVRSRTAVPA